MWIIASIPFWLLGAVAFAVPFIALLQCRSDNEPFTFDMAMGSAAIWVCAGGLFVVAALIAS